MVNYGNGLIYKLCCNDTNIKEEYVGSTVNFNERKRTHRDACINPNNERYNMKVYKFIRENNGWDNWRMILVERFPCNDRRELETRERYFIELLESKLNGKIPTRTRKEYVEDNKDKIKEYQKVYRVEKKDEIKEKRKVYEDKNVDKFKEYRKVYYIENKDEILERRKEYRVEKKDEIKEKKKEKIICECGCEVNKDHIARHRQSQKHINLMIVKNNTEIKN